MSDRWLIASGNVADPTKWDGGVSVPDPTDDCHANGFTGTISADWTVNSISNRVGASWSADGTFTVSANQTGSTTVTCDVLGGTVTCYTGVQGSVLVGNIYGSNTTGIYTAVVSAGGIIIGNIYKGTTTNAHGAYLSNGAKFYGDMPYTPSAGSNTLAVSFATSAYHCEGTVEASSGAETSRGANLISLNVNYNGFSAGTLYMGSIWCGEVSDSIDSTSSYTLRVYGGAVIAPTALNLTTGLGISIIGGGPVYFVSVNGITPADLYNPSGYQVIELDPDTNVIARMLYAAATGGGSSSSGVYNPFIQQRVR